MRKRVGKKSSMGSERLHCAFPRTIGKLRIIEIRKIVRAMEAAGDHRLEVRLVLADRFGVPPNMIDWCSAQRTRALRIRSTPDSPAWPFVAA